jgi:hypothetical protein
VAFYGPKRGLLGRLLRSWQQRLGRSIRQLGAQRVFRPYPLAQIHATILGLERVPGLGLHNRNMHDLGGRLQAMRLPELFGFILDSGRLPFDVQFGGFEERDEPFRSRGARPFQRSFSIQGRTAVVIGWPVHAARDGRPAIGEWPLPLEELRRSAQRFNVRHRWHRAAADVDNDLYLRLGVLDGELTQAQREVVEHEMRQALCESPPATVRISADDLAIVAYPAGEETLPVGRSEVVRLTDPRLRREDSSPRSTPEIRAAQRQRRPARARLISGPRSLDRSSASCHPPA